MTVDRLDLKFVISYDITIFVGLIVVKIHIPLYTLLTPLASYNHNKKLLSILSHSYYIISASYHLFQSEIFLKFLQGLNSILYARNTKNKNFITKNTEPCSSLDEQSKLSTHHRGRIFYQ